MEGRIVSMKVGDRVRVRDGQAGIVAAWAGLTGVVESVNQSEGSCFVRTEDNILFTFDFCDLDLAQEAAVPASDAHLAAWKCLNQCCPDRYPITAVEPPRCYTCGVEMSLEWLTNGSVPEFIAPKTTQGIEEVLDNIRRQMCIASMIPLTELPTTEWNAVRDPKPRH